jgi:hypothetical protein
MPSLTELLEHQSVLIVEATIPAGMTIAEWRRGRATRSPERTVRPRPRRRLRLGQGGTQ